MESEIVTPETPFAAPTKGKKHAWKTYGMAVAALAVAVGLGVAVHHHMKTAKTQQGAAAAAKTAAASAAGMRAASADAPWNPAATMWDEDDKAYQKAAKLGV